MAVTRISSGSATVVLDAPDAAWVREAVSRAMGGALRALEAEAERVAADARREWYGPNGVERETGRSGDIQVVTTVDTAASEVRVGIGSADTRKAGGKPVPVYVHRRWGKGLEPKAVTRDEWLDWRRKGLPALPPPPESFGRRDGRARSDASLRAEAAAKAFWSNKDNIKGLTVGKWYIKVAGDNVGTTGTSRGYLLVELVRTPGREMARRIAPEVARAIAARMSRG